MRNTYTNPRNSSSTPKSQKDRFSSDATIMRSPHDPRTPYVVIKKSLVDDTAISMECAYLLINILSKSEDCEICIPLLIKELEGRASEKKIRKLLDEAITAGYLVKETIR